MTGYIEPVVVILHEHELTWAGRVSWKHHTCMISALSISTTLKQHPLIWSAMVSLYFDYDILVLTIYMLFFRECGTLLRAYHASNILFLYSYMTNINRTYSRGVRIVFHVLHPITVRKPSFGCFVYHLLVSLLGIDKLLYKK